MGEWIFINELNTHSDTHTRARVSILIGYIIHLFTGGEWNSSFIQAEAGTIPQWLVREE